MGLWQRMNEKIKYNIRAWLDVKPQVSNITIEQRDTHENYCIKNAVWYRGDAYELEQLAKQDAETSRNDKYKFWAANASAGLEMRKVHTGLPALIVRTLSAIVLNDFLGIDFDSEAEGAQVQAEIWDDIADENNFEDLLKRATQETLVKGDGAFKISIDTSISKYPILQFYPAERIEVEKKHGRLFEIVFKTAYKHGNNDFILCEHYGRGYIKSELYNKGAQVPLNSIPQTETTPELITFDKEIILGHVLRVYDSAKYAGRGGSIYDGKLDAFDALDEVWSQWLDAVRAGRAKTYIPDILLPRDPETGVILKPNPFDCRFISSGSNMTENAKNQIYTDQPIIQTDSYLVSFSSALDLCLQGVISPSTLGIDTKKLDNAEAQREKEKTTLYTRDAIINALSETVPEVVKACIDAYFILNKTAGDAVGVTMSFGEYANPSFESQVETVSKARTGGIMSIEASIEELYGDTKTDEWKREEAERLRQESGITTLEEPAVNLDGVTITEG